MSDPAPAASAEPSIAVVIGARGGIGAALLAALAEDARYDQVVALGRPTLDLLREESIEAAAGALPPGRVRLVIHAAGVLHDGVARPEKSLREIDPVRLAHAFAINATGPALVMKHFLPHLPRRGRAVFAALSARVGSIGDNRLGGWHAYRASKAAMNQLLRGAAIELARTHPDAICVALHPGTVATPLSAPFARPGQALLTPDEAARHLLAVLDRLTPEDSGGFLDWRGETVPW